MLVYSKEKMEHALSLMAPPHSLTVAEVARRTGVKEKTLYNWRTKARIAGSARPGDWKPEDRFAMVVETLGLTESERAEYCRRKGVFVEQLLQWRSACMQATAGAPERDTAAALAEERRRARQLEKELGRKERALAETAALLVLSRKLEALRNQGEDA